MATWSVGQRALLTWEDEALLNRLLDSAVIKATTFLPSLGRLARRRPRGWRRALAGSPAE